MKYIEYALNNWANENVMFSVSKEVLLNKVYNNLGININGAKIAPINKAVKN